MTDFKVGDKVVGVEHHDGEAGVVDEIRSLYIYVKMDGGGTTGVFWPKELKLVKPEPKFKVGDWVKVQGRGDKWDGTVGTVQKVKAPSYSKYTLYTIHKNDVGDDKKRDISENVLSFFEYQLVATDAPQTDFSKLYSYAEFDAKLTAKVLGYFDGGKVSEPNEGENSHYGGADNPYEVIKVAEAWGFHDNAYLFNALKYLGRCEHKGNKVKDLKKLVDYVQREIALEEAK